MRTNTRKLALNSILLAMGLLLHQITPALGLPMQPDMALIMLFIIMILNKEDYKICLVAGIVTGIFTAMTTKFPAGQVPNMVDKIITVNLIYMLMYILYKLPFIKNLKNKQQDLIVASVMLPIGTLLSGCVFLLSAQVLVGLPGPFETLFLIAVVPAIVINLLVGLFLFKIVNVSISRGGYQRVNNK
ncbi:tryptophan transporter [Clostridium sp. CCUG 7971]|uniref:tryptophan transporter n=1 Tax=Clostridium sp. CCUG 7971 TaxID=2811414 RepID=UPI001ABB485B|nr:tryptophan transporter [Clostridium sp. CCUG 7971]MBO3442955.1 tryptophan transporter [Clostridium sp. CCUG 7971]